MEKDCIFFNKKTFSPFQQTSLQKTNAQNIPVTGGCLVTNTLDENYVKILSALHCPNLNFWIEFAWLKSKFCLIESHFFVCFKNPSREFRPWELMKWGMVPHYAFTLCESWSTCILWTHAFEAFESNVPVFIKFWLWWKEATTKRGHEWKQRLSRKLLHDSFAVPWYCTDSDLFWEVLHLVGDLVWLLAFLHYCKLFNVRGILSTKPQLYPNQCISSTTVQLLLVSWLWSNVHWQSQGQDWVSKLI